LKNEETPLRKVSKIDQQINTKTDAQSIEKLINNGAKKPSKIHLKIDRKNDAKMMPKRRSFCRVGVIRRRPISNTYIALHPSL